MQHRFLVFQLFLIAGFICLFNGCSREQESTPAVAAVPALDVIALTDRVAELEDRAQRLRDINAIKRLQRVYGYYFDQAMWDEVLALFSDNATIELALDGVYAGKDSIRRYLYALTGGQPGLPAGVLSQHLQLQPVIDIAPGGNTAQGRWRELIMAGSYGENALWGEGPSEHTYIKENGVWKIKSIHWYETLLVPYQGGWAAERADLHDGKFVSDRVLPDAPPSEEYEVWPGVYLPPYHYKNPVTGQ